MNLFIIFIIIILLPGVAFQLPHPRGGASYVSGYSEPIRSSVALGFAFLTRQATSSGSLTVSLTLLRRDGAFMQSISDQAGEMQLCFFVSALRKCNILNLGLGFGAVNSVFMAAASHNLLWQNRWEMIQIIVV
ncbi:Hypothetical_protein [Hexamita inflata]|uniref:Hypothetical_protein n=1 Tax=Hexamita inflata TaxID=28002 RepID=A0AA86QR82_9EUKA|nr:Hypothetical protein HINF_LOCUS45384 [Hexamita inflata]